MSALLMCRKYTQKNYLCFGQISCNIESIDHRQQFNEVALPQTSLENTNLFMPSWLMPEIQTSFSEDKVVNLLGLNILGA